MTAWGCSARRAREFPRAGATRCARPGKRRSTWSCVDLSARWTIRRGLDLRGGVNNLFDKDPPIVTRELISGGAANSYELYDGLGRQLFLAMTAKF